MEVYRLCNQQEFNTLKKSKSFENLGSFCENNPNKNNYQYNKHIKYLHFFKNIYGILYLKVAKDRYILVLDIPDEILNQHIGKGKYLDFVNLENLHLLDEFAIMSKDVKFEYLKKIYKINQDKDFDYYPSENEIYQCLDTVDLYAENDLEK